MDQCGIFRGMVRNHQVILNKNLLRAERGAVSHILGGCDSHDRGPFDNPSHYPTRHGGRMTGVFYDGYVSMLKPAELRVKNFREPGPAPAVAGYPGEETKICAPTLDADRSPEPSLCVPALRVPLGILNGI